MFEVQRIKKANLPYKISAYKTNSKYFYESLIKHSDYKIIYNGVTHSEGDWVVIAPSKLSNGDCYNICKNFNCKHIPKEF